MEKERTKKGNKIKIGTIVIKKIDVDAITVKNQFKNTKERIIK